MSADEGDDTPGRFFAGGVAQQLQLSEYGAKLWAKADGWDKDQTALLLTRIEPLNWPKAPEDVRVWVDLGGVTGNEEMLDLVGGTPTLTRYRLLLDLAEAAGKLRFPCAPAAAIAWADGKGEPVPQVLRAAVEGSAGAGDARPLKTKERDNLRLTIRAIARIAKLDPSRPDTWVDEKGESFSQVVREVMTGSAGSAGDAHLLGTEDRDKVYLTIRTLARKAGLDLWQPYKAGGIVAEVVLKELKGSLTTRAIGDFLKAARG